MDKIIIVVFVLINVLSGIYVLSDLHGQLGQDITAFASKGESYP